MELQKKFEEIINDYLEQSKSEEFIVNNVAKECAKLCLEEKIRVLNNIQKNTGINLKADIEFTQQQLKIIISD